jgi:hypothetical protein
VGAERKRPAVDDLVAGGVEDLDVLAFVEDCVRARAGGDGCWGHGGWMVWVEGLVLWCWAFGRSGDTRRWKYGWMSSKFLAVIRVVNIGRFLLYLLRGHTFQG